MHTDKGKTFIENTEGTETSKEQLDDNTTDCSHYPKNLFLVFSVYLC
jgi:hypothetical protein